MQTMLPPRYWRNINHINVSPANLHKRTLKSKINLPYPPVNPWLVMSPEKTNEHYSYSLTAMKDEEQ
jgi:hypothetical protein